MESIRLNSVIPAIFAQRKDWNSEIWGRDVVFERSKLYLIEADSGKGKSTFCSYISGYRKDYTGSLFFDETDIKHLNVNDWVNCRKIHISHLFQELRLFPELTAFENVEIKNRLTRFKTPKDITTWFEILGIADKMNTKIGRMSFGQQQRVAMIRALVQPFDFIIADEPISHLDDNNSRIMGNLMMEEAGKHGAGVIVTSIGKHIGLSYDKILRL